MWLPAPAFGGPTAERRVPDSLKEHARVQDSDLEPLIDEDKLGVGRFMQDVVLLFGR
jgi:hypothetical protein